MADHTLFFEELVAMPNLRAKSYVVHDVGPAGLACIQVSARRLEDWFFARRWVQTRSGRRLLFWLLDEVEAAGFRFQVHAGAVSDSTTGEPWQRASEQWRGLTREERRIHAELFPAEERLLDQGYDWDDRAVYVRGLALPSDAAGRVLEERDGILHEWVRIPDEFTWRRYPLHTIAAAGVASAGAPSVDSAA